MDRRHFFTHASGILLAASSSLSWADDDREQSTRKVKKSDTPKASPTLPANSGPAKSRVIVVGGGMAGATVAKYLRLLGDDCRSHSD